jgi:lipopolysaccharide export system permease protein
MMKRIDQYLVRQYIGTFLFILGIVLVICLVVDVVEKIDDFLEKKPPLEDILFKYYPNFIYYWGSLLAPICVFLGVIFFTSRLASRTELIPLLSSGVSFYRILAPYLITSFVMAGASFYLKSFLVPESTATRLEFEYDYLRKRRISSTKNVHKKVAKDTYLYISYYNEKRKEGHTIGLERLRNDSIITKLRARKMEWVDSTQSWRLEDVERREIRGLEERLTRYKSLDTTFLLTPDDIYIKEQWAESMTLPYLMNYIKLEEMRGSDILEELYLERHRRFSDPLAMVILTLIGFAMASRKRRGGIALQIGLGIMICFIYVALIFAGQAVVGEDVPAWLAVWFPNLIFFPLALFLLRQAPK